MRLVLSDQPDPGLLGKAHKRFRFQPLNPELIRERLMFIIHQEKWIQGAGVMRSVEYTEDGVNALLDLAHGDMRRVINILQVGLRDDDDG